VAIEGVDSVGALLDVAQGFSVLAHFPQDEKGGEVGLEGKFGLYTAMAAV